MSTLRSGIDEYAAEDLGRLSDAAVEEGLVELEVAAGALEAQRLRWVAELDRRKAWQATGHTCMEAWLADRLRLGRGAANRVLRRARGLDRMPSTREALSSGAISRGAMEVLVAAREGREAAFARDEDELVAEAAALPVGRLYRRTRFWRFEVDVAGGMEEFEAVREQRFLHASRTLFGMVRLDGELDPETGEVVLSALGAAVDADVRGGGWDERTPAQRRADALGEVCRQWLDSAERPTVAGERPHVSLSVDVGSLRGDRGSEAAFGSGEPVPGSVARRVLCDASVSRIVMRGRSEVLDVGRRTPVVPPAIRRAVVARDGGCRFPGCDRPPPWCDAHHVKHWADGGETGLGNLVLLCRRHHRLQHADAGFDVTIVEGRPEFRGPDGMLLEDRAPP